MESDVSAPLPTEEPLTVPVDPVHVDENNWTIGQWSGLPNYECKACPFSTLDLPVMEEHQKERHSPKPEAPVGAQSRKRYMRRE